MLSVCILGARLTLWRRVQRDAIAVMMAEFRRSLPKYVEDRGGMLTTFDIEHTLTVLPVADPGVIAAALARKPKTLKELTGGKRIAIVAKKKDRSGKKRESRAR